MTLSHGSGDSSLPDIIGTVPTTNESTAVGVGVSALFYVYRWDALRAYLSPRVSYSRTGSSTTSSSGSATDSRVWSYLTSGSFGAQYSLGRRFGLFGEIGLGYSATTSTLSTTLTISVSSPLSPVPSTRTQLIRSDGHSNTLSTRSGAGVIFFF